MPVRPNLLERLVLFRLDRGPAPMLDLIGAAGFEAVALALEIDLFETLAAAGGGLTASDLADRTDADADGLARLADFLVVTGYLAADGDRYRLTGMTETWLLDGAADLGPFFTFWHDQVLPFWRHELETAVRTGAPSRTLYDALDEDPARWRLAQAGFRSAASVVIDDVVDAVSVPDGPATLIDVGGGHGRFAAELCRRHPALSATVFDTPAAVAAVEADWPDDLDGRLATRAGDYTTDDLGTGYDLALVFNVIHAHDPAANVALFERVADALAPGGRVVVLDQWANSGRSAVGRAALAFIALNYLVTLAGDVYSHEAVASWLREAGFSAVRRTSVGPLSGLAVVEATTPVE